MIAPVRTVLVTGGTGLLGRAVLERLAGSAQLVALHRPGTDPPTIAGVEWIAQDLAAPLRSDLPAQLDAVLHLAQSRRHRDFPDGAVDTFEINAAATVRLLDLCRRAGGRRFVHASSGAVYAPGPEPLREDDAPAPPSFYGHAKLAAERAVQAFGGCFEVAILRFFFVHGPLQDAGAFVPGLAARIRAGEPIELRGPDGMRCNPIAVEDAAAAVEAAWSGEGAVGVVNVAGSEVLALRALGERIGRRIGIPPRYVERPGTGDLVADVAHMHRLLGPPQMPLDEALARTLSARLPRPS